MSLRNVTVYCASSGASDPVYREAAHTLGRILAEAGLCVICGGGAVGSMGTLIDGALAAGGHVEGVLPRFMFDLEWAHARLSALHIVDDMHARKRLMVDRADAIVALPGGCGTLEELFEAITWKRLGLLFAPIVLCNTQGFFDPCVELLERCVSERFMAEKHRDIWRVVPRPEDVLECVRTFPAWPRTARTFAVA
jgi:hypothetical protein